MNRFLTVLLIAAAMVSCKKDKDSTESKSKTTLLTQKAWHPVNVQQRSVSTDPWETNNFSTQPCAQDDIWTFGTNASYVWDEGATICGSGNPQVNESGTYVFTNNETHLTISITNIPGVTPVEDWTIEQLDENTFIYNFYFPTGPYYRYTMSH